MGQIQSYYRILGLEADASVEEIRDAIQNMRDLDTGGNYSAILNKMEKTLLPLSSRPRPNTGNTASPATESWSIPDFPETTRQPAAEAENTDPRPSHSGHSKFLDLGDEASYEGRHAIDRTPVQDNRTYITDAEIRAYNRPPSALSKIFNFKNIILLLLACGVGAAGFVFGMPLYQQYMANRQGNEAMPELTRAKDEADAYIRKNHYFPDTLTGSYNNPLYSVSSHSADETIRLTFSQEAAEPLRGHSLIMRTEQVANIGLQWRCDISQGFPQMHKPTQCF